MSGKTNLYEWHQRAGANMAEFGGYEMPLWYPTGIRAEHRAVLTTAGLFDTSHMALLRVEGPEAWDVLQRTHTRDLHACVGRERKPLGPGDCTYGAFLNERGWVLDDAIVYGVAPEAFLVVVNSGMGGKVAGHLKSSSAGSEKVTIVDLSDRLGKLDLQGPAAARILSRVLQSPEQTLGGMAYFSSRGHFDSARPESGRVRLHDGTPVLLSRTGYTGEFGFEIYVDGESTASVWDQILEAGEPFGLLPCGLAARDSLRAGAVLPLSHQDIGDWPFVHHPWVFALPRGEGGVFTKDFIGRDALEKADDAPWTFPFLGRDLRKVSTPGARVLDEEGRELGCVLTCVSDMGIGRSGDRVYSEASPERPEGFQPKGLCCGFVRVDRRLRYGQEIQLRDDKRSIRVDVVEDIRPDRTARRPVEAMLA